MASNPFDFVPETYEEWLNHHHKVTAPIITRLFIEKFPKLMTYGFIKKEKSE